MFLSIEHIKPVMSQRQLTASTNTKKSINIFDSFRFAIDVQHDSKKKRKNLLNI